MELTLPRPDDWHLHLRDGSMLTSVAQHTAAHFDRALVMPNLAPPIVTVADAISYRERIMAALPSGSTFAPLMALYLTDTTSPADIAEAAASPHVIAAKLYPAGATTNSDSGVTNLDKLSPVLEQMAESGVVLCIHGEVTDPEVDIFDREKRFIDTVLSPLVARFPTLRVVLEHLTTRDAVEFVREGSDNIGATLTAHHLLMNRNDIFVGGIRPHHYCLPILKRDEHRVALLEAATCGSPKFFLGTDSAPHARDRKESACGCAGMYTAWHALPLYAEAFDSVDALEQLAGFASMNGADFYQLPRNSETITLRREPLAVPSAFEAGDDTLIPLRAGAEVAWRVVG